MYPHLIVHNVPVCNIKAAKMYPHCGFRSLILISEQKVLGNCVLFILSDSTFVKSDTFFISASLAKVSRAQFDIAAAAVKLLGFSDICRCHVGCSCSAHCVRGDHPMAGITLLEYCATNMWVSHNGLLAPSPDVCHCYTASCVAKY